MHFKLKVYETSGEAFQSLFGSIYAYYDPRFQPVAPHGNQGDGGNDGWIPEDTHYFQVYGPKPLTALTWDNAEKKAAEDYQKIVGTWGVVDRYDFVFNDRFQGVPAPLDAAMAKLKKEKGLSHCRCLSSAQLENIFDKLEEDRKLSVIGGVPGPVPEAIDVRAVGEVLRHLADTDSGFQLTFHKDAAPNFDEKIQFNGLTGFVQRDLERNSTQVHLVDRFLNAQGGGLAVTAAVEVNKLYEESKSAIPDSADEASNLRYFWMVNTLIPNLAKANVHSLKAYREAAAIVLAKYFETCDAYERPDNVGAAQAPAV